MTIEKSNSFTGKKSSQYLDLSKFDPIIFGSKEVIDGAVFYPYMVYPLNPRMKELYNPESQKMVKVTTQDYYNQYEIERDEVNDAAVNFLTTLNPSMFQTNYKGDFLDLPNSPDFSCEEPGVHARRFFNYCVNTLKATIESSEKLFIYSSGTIVRFVLDSSNDLHLALFYLNGKQYMDQIVQLGLITSEGELFVLSSDCDVTPFKSCGDLSFNSFESQETLQQSLDSIKSALPELAKEYNCSALLDLFKVDILDSLQVDAVDDSPIVCKPKGDSVEERNKVIFKLFVELNSRIIDKSKELGVPTRSSKQALFRLLDLGANLEEVAARYKIPSESLQELVSTVFNDVKFTKYLDLSFSEDFEEELEELQDRPEMTAGDPVELPKLELEFGEQRTIEDKFFVRACKKYLKNMNEDFVRLGTYLYYCVLSDCPSLRVMERCLNKIANDKFSDVYCRHEQGKLLTRPGYCYHGRDYAYFGSPEFHYIDGEDTAMVINLAYDCYFSTRPEFKPTMALLVDRRSYGCSYVEMNFSKAYEVFNLKEFLSRVESEENKKLFSAFFKELALVEQEHPKSLEGLIDDLAIYLQISEERRTVISTVESGFYKYYLWSFVGPRTSSSTFKTPVLKEYPVPASFVHEIFLNLLCGFPNEKSLYDRTLVSCKIITDEKYDSVGYDYTIKGEESLIIDSMKFVLRYSKFPTYENDNPVIYQGETYRLLDFLNEVVPHFNDEQLAYFNEHMLPIVKLVYFATHYLDGYSHKDAFYNYPTMLVWDSNLQKFDVAPSSITRVLADDPEALDRLVAGFSKVVQPIIRPLIEELLDLETKRLPL